MTALDPKTLRAVVEKLDRAIDREWRHAATIEQSIYADVGADALLRFRRALVRLSRARGVK